jgi:PhnB protein
VDWYVRAFGAEVVARYDETDGRLGHAMLSVAGGAVYLADEFPELGDRIGARTPRTLGGTSVMVALAIDDVDAWLARAVEAGAEVLKPATEEFYGRQAKVRDPFGHVWTFTGTKKS